MKYLNLTGLQYFWQKIKIYVNTLLDQLAQQVVNVYNFAKKKDVTGLFSVSAGSNFALVSNACKILRAGDHYQVVIGIGVKCTAYTYYTVDHNPVNITFPADLANAMVAAGFTNLYQTGVFNRVQSGVAKNETLMFALKKGSSNVFSLIASKEQCVFNVNDTMNINVVFDFIA